MIFHDRDGDWKFQTISSVISNLKKVCKAPTPPPIRVRHIVCFD